MADILSQDEIDALLSATDDPDDYMDDIIFFPKNDYYDSFIPLNSREEYCIDDKTGIKVKRKDWYGYSGLIL
ncbi:MAG: hypothetical protein KKC19_03565 [Nanoarchaeota archaeon]|nr:hypothetical protein [Nanoarchaeota archaeon]